MPVNVFTTTPKIELVGPIAAINDGSAPQSIPQAIATSGTIAIPAGCNSIRLTAAAAATSVVLTAGTFDGQLLFITITTAAANTVTFAAAGTSNVAGGTATSLAGLACHLLRWDANSSLWFQVGPLAN